jgi:hypothetical protein
LGRIIHLDKDANGVYAQNVLNAMDVEQGKMMNNPLDKKVVRLCGAGATNTNATTTTTTSGSSPTCTGNQVEGSCTQASLPSASPNSGPRGPVCNKVGTNNYVRLNADKTKQGASDYCKNLISGNIVLNKDSTSVKAGIITGASEGGGDVSLALLFDVDSCDPNTKDADQEVDFGAMKQSDCETNLYTSLSQVCK